MLWQKMGDRDIFMEDMGRMAVNNHSLWEERKIKRTVVWGTWGRSFLGLGTAGQSRTDRFYECVF